MASDNASANGVIRERPAMSKASRGFTLIELLVVIAIIAVLIAPLATRRASGTRGREADSVREQHEAARSRDA